MMTAPTRFRISSESFNNNQISFAWDAVSGSGISYKLFSSTAADTAPELRDELAQTTATSLNTTSLVRYQDYYIWVQACLLSSCSDDSTSVHALLSDVTVPSNLKFTLVTDGRVKANRETVTVSWDAVAGATRYEILQHPTFKDITKARFLGSLTTTSLHHKEPLIEEYNHYWVRACDANNCSKFVSGKVFIEPSYLTDGRDHARAIRHGNFVSISAAGQAHSWGERPESPPSNNDFATITMSAKAFAGIRTDGRIRVWGSNNHGGDQSKSPTQNAFVKIHATDNTFAALRSNGQVAAWYKVPGPGDAYYSGSYPPTGTGHHGLAANLRTYTVIKSNGSPTTWGAHPYGTGNAGEGPPGGSGYVKVTANNSAYAALRSDGYIRAWGKTSHGSSGEPSWTGFEHIQPSERAFAALHTNGYIRAWGNNSFGGYQPHVPAGNDFVRLYSNGAAFAALKEDGSIAAWGNNAFGGNSALAPKEKDFVRITPSYAAFAALKEDSSIQAWGHSGYGGNQAEVPTGKGFVQIHSTQRAFAALHKDGSIQAWGNNSYGGNQAEVPTGKVFTRLYANDRAFAALTADGEVFVWGPNSHGGDQSEAPTGMGHSFNHGRLNPYGVGIDTPTNLRITSQDFNTNQLAFAWDAVQGSGITYKLLSAPATNTAPEEREVLAITKNTHFNATNYQQYQDYYVWVQACFFDFCSEHSAGIHAILSDVATPSLRVSQTLPGKVDQEATVLSWDAVAGATSYEVLHSAVFNDITKAQSLGNPSGNSFRHLKPLISDNNYYWVRACNTNCSEFVSGEVFIEPSYFADGRRYSQGLLFGNFVSISATGQAQSWGQANASAPLNQDFVAVTANQNAYAGLTASGEIKAWGDTASGGTGAPSGNDYQAIYTSLNAFAALKQDGSIQAWGNNIYGGNQAEAPSGNGFVKIHSSQQAFAALKQDGSIQAWGNNIYGGNQAEVPSGNGFLEITSSLAAFAALNSDGSIQVWGHNAFGGNQADVPSGNGFVQITSSQRAFAALRSDGSIQAWGSNAYGGNQADVPAGKGFVRIYASAKAFAALHQDGSVTAWGHTTFGGNMAEVPKDKGFVRIIPQFAGFAALKEDGSIKAWGHSDSGGNQAEVPSGTGFVQIHSTRAAYAALHEDGSIRAWGNNDWGGNQADVPSGNNFVRIYGTDRGFAAVTAYGEVHVWGNSAFGGDQAQAPTGNRHSFNHGRLDVKVPPLQVQNLQASRQFDQNFTLSWDFNILANFHRVYRSTSNSFASASLLSDSVTNNSYEDTTLTAGTNYFYFVEACNEFGCSAPSNSLLSSIPPSLSLALVEDTGLSSSDNVSYNGNILAGNLEALASYRYSIDGGENFINGTGSQFTLPQGLYAAGSIQAYQTNSFGIESDIATTSAIEIIALDAPELSTTQSIVKVGNNQVISNLNFLSNSGGEIQSYSISNADSGGSLTANTGLSLNTSTGRLSGTSKPTAVPPATYTITAVGPTGLSSQTTIQIEITNGIQVPALSSLDYNAVAEIQITETVKLPNTGGNATTWVITGPGVTGPSISGIYDIGNGLSFSQTTGQVTGTPAGPAAQLTYSVRADNAGGQGNTVDFNLTVLSKPVSNARVPKIITSYPIITGQTEAGLEVRLGVDTNADASNFEAIYVFNADPSSGNWTLDLSKDAPSTGSLPDFSSYTNDQIMTFKITATKPNGAYNILYKKSTISTESSYSISDSRIIEGVDGSKTMVFTVVRDGNNTTPGSVEYAVQTGVSTAKNSQGTTSGVTNTYAGGSGTIENDYAGNNTGSVNFDAYGPQVKTIEFTVNGDYWKEINQKLIVSIATPTAGTIARAKGIGIIDEIDMNAMTSAFSLSDVNFEKPTYAIRVRRSSDNVEQDIGFDEDGNLDTASLLSFVGTSSADVGFVTIWYDQSARDEHATQTDPNRQPTIVSTGTVRTNSAGLPAIIFNENVVNADVNGTDSESFNIAGTGVQATNIEIFIGYEYNTKEPGFAFNLGLQAVGGMISTHAPWSNGQTYWDVDNGPVYGNSRLHAQGAQIIDTYQDLIFAANLNFAGVGSANLNRTDARQSFFVDGEVIRASEGTFPANWAIPTNANTWKIGATLDETRPQQMRVNEFLIYTNENSTPIEDSSQFIGSSANDSFTFAGDLEGIKAGFGYDALLISASSTPSITLDSTANIANNTIAIDSIERIDARDNAQTDTIAITDAVVDSTGRDTLEIHLDDTDTLRISSGFTLGGSVIETFNGVSYRKFTNGALTLYVFGAASVLNL